MKKRLFVGLPLPQNILSEIDKIEKNIDKRLAWIPIENLHLTLIFLGWAEESAVLEICSIFEKIKIKPFTLKVAKIDYSPGNRMIWVYFAKSEQLINLQKQLVNLLKETNIPLREESREYLPHINLIRLKEARSKKILKNLNQEFEAQEINLYESKIEKPFAKYEVLKTKRLVP